MVVESVKLGTLNLRITIGKPYYYYQWYFRSNTKGFRGRQDYTKDLVIYQVVDLTNKEIEIIEELLSYTS